MTKAQHESPKVTLELPPCDHVPSPYEGPSREEVLEMRREFLTPALLTYYRDPIMIVEGHMQWLFDHTGRRYLDGLAGIVTVSVGHCHPDVVAAVQEQSARLQHATTIYLHPTIAEFGKKLAGTFPKGSGLSAHYFTNSGSEANELAMLISRVHTGNHEIIALRNAYHGMTNEAMGLCGLHTWKQNYASGFGVKHAKFPDCYRGPFGYDDPQAGEAYAEEVLDLIRHGTTGEIAAFIAEPIQGVGGSREIPQGFLPKVYEYVRAAGGLCISDEVQTGFGRTGSAFWGFENHDVIPDIVTMAKGIGNGAPLACCTTTHAIAESMTGRIHFNTYGGNAVSMAAGLATLNVLLKEKVQERAAEIGAYLRAGLDDLKSRHTLVGDVRGRGLMLGVEFVLDHATKTPAPAQTSAIMERARELGLLIGKGGLDGNVLRIKPPMCWTHADCDFACAVLDQCIAEQE